MAHSAVPKDKGASREKGPEEGKGEGERQQVGDYCGGGRCPLRYTFGLHLPAESSSPVACLPTLRGPFGSEMETCSFTSACHSLSFSLRPPHLHFLVLLSTLLASFWFLLLVVES